MKQLLTPLSILLSIGLMMPASSSGKPQDRVLEPDKRIEEELTGGSTHSYRVALSSGQFLHVMVQQRGIDLVVTLRDPNGATLSEMDGLRWPSGMEELSGEAASTGQYIVEVRGKGRSDDAGRYELTIQRTEVTNQQDRSRIAAERLFMEAIRLDTQGRGAPLEPALKKYEEALTQWRAAGVRKWEGQTLNSLGSVYRNLNEHEKALALYDQGLHIMRELKEPDREASLLYNLGLTYSSLNQYEKARQYYEQALAFWRETGNRTGEALVLNGLGIVHLKLRTHETARKYFELALVIRRESKNRNSEAQAMFNIGLTYSDLGQYARALDHYEQALTIWRETGNRIGESQVINSLGIVYRNLSQNQKAREYLERSLAITRETKDRYGEAQALNNLGEVSSGLGQNDRAREFYEQSLTIVRELKNRSDEGAILSNLCSVNKRLEQLTIARNYCEQSLAIARATGDKNREGKSLNNLGEIYRVLNQYDNARQHYELALAIMRETGDKLNEAIGHTNLGGIYQLLRQPEKAQAHLEQSLAIRREIGDRDGEAQTLLGFAVLERDRGRFLEAIARIESAIAIKENLRAVYTNKDLRSTYSASLQTLYEFYIELLMFLDWRYPSAGYDAKALQASEQSRARVLLEMLTEAGADIRQGVDPQLLAGERSLQSKLNLKAQLQLKLLGSSYNAVQAAALAKEIDELTTEYEQIRARIRESSPRYATLMQPSALSLKEIQQLLDPDTLLLEYYLTQQRSYLWVVSQTAITSYVLSKRDKIESAARRVYESFSTSNPTLDNSEAARELSRMLLEPAAAQLGKKRLLIVSDGYLQYLPFAALPDPTLTNSIQPLIVEHEIVSLPSASLLSVLRREFNSRSPAPKLVAALADPVFDRNDLRLKQNAPPDSPVLQLPPELERSLRDSGGITFERLRSSRIEAETIVRMARAGDNLKALDFDASRATALSDKLGQYRIVHFATHGLLNSVHPELSGLVLSLVDEKGQAQDGFLRAHEVYNLKLGADLVVLSACQTALGKEVKGEGLVGLTRGFMYAGAPRVVASLWRVPSKATAELMTRFYQGMFVRKLRPAAALRAAQIEMWREKRWNEPFYWAAFVIQGEW
jgi:CHAT domain-containing protein/tetratricopeptide (TPR) repeat protein